MSEKRKDVLFYLHYEGPKTLTEIKDQFNVSSPDILPRLREMEKFNLITRDEKSVYHITQTGSILAGKYKPLLDTIQVFEGHDGFWNTHDLTPIPYYLLDRIQELKECRVIKEEQGYVYDTHREFVKNVSSSKKFKGITTVFFSY